jgi:hypothetical protein
VEIELLERPEGDVIARGSYHGGPAYQFAVGADGQVYFQVVGDTERIWAGPDAGSFRRIAAAWQQYRREVGTLPSEAAQLARVGQLRGELTQLGALPAGLPPDPEPLWSLLVFEAEHGMA